MKNNKIPIKPARKSKRENVLSGEKYCIISIERPYTNKGKPFHNQKDCRRIAKSIKIEKTKKTKICITLSFKAKLDGKLSFLVAIHAPKTIKKTSNKRTLTLNAVTPLK